MKLYSILDLGYVQEGAVVDCARSICKSGVVMLQLRAKSIEQKNADAVLSFGNTGALMTLSALNIKTLPEIKRPSIASIWPNMKGERRRRKPIAIIDRA